MNKIIYTFYFNIFNSYISTLTRYVLSIYLPLPGLLPFFKEPLRHLPIKTQYYIKEFEKTKVSMHVLLKHNFKPTSAVITLRLLSSNNGVGHHFSRRCYTPTISFLFMALNSEVCSVRFAPGHIRVRCSSWIA